MVWVMSFPSSFGDFWPDGRAEGGDVGMGSGWKDRLNEYYAVQSVEKKLELYEENPDYGYRYSAYVCSKFNREIGKQDPLTKAVLTPIVDHEVPEFYQVFRTLKSIASYVMLSGLGYAVDETLKNIIETVEPGVHQFFPFELRMSRGKIHPVQYYILVIGQYLDSFSTEDSANDAWQRTELGNIRYQENSAKNKGLAFRKAVFKGAHLWREKKVTRPLFCLSDELIVEIKKVGLRIPKHYQAREV